MLLRRFLALAFTLALSACATDSEIVDFRYATPMTTATATFALPIEITAVDMRPRQDRFSSKTDAYGYEHAPISSTEPVPAIVENAIAAELSARGYKLGKNGVRVDIAILTFYTRFTDHPGPFTQDTAEGRVALRVEVRRGGRIAFSKTALGANSIRAPTQLHWGGTAAESLSEALRRALARLVDDPDFRRVLSDHGT